MRHDNIITIVHDLVVSESGGLGPALSTAAPALCRVMVADVGALAANPALLEAAAACLSPYRRDKLAAISNLKVKTQSAGAGLLLDVMLEAHGLREADMNYATGQHGKPSFTTHDNLHFSLSHSGSMVACALGDKPLGVDIQTLTRPRRSLMEYTLSPGELATVDALPDDEERARLFTQLWTLKECYAKATGRGLTHEFPAFKVLDDTHAVPSIPLSPPATFYTVPLPGAHLSLAVLA